MHRRLSFALPALLIAALLQLLGPAMAARVLANAGGAPDLGAICSAEGHAATAAVAGWSATDQALPDDPTTDRAPADHGHGLACPLCPASCGGGAQLPGLAPSAAAIPVPNALGPSTAAFTAADGLRAVPAIRPKARAPPSLS